MQYFGGKKRIAKQIVEFISPYLKNKDYYGGCFYDNELFATEDEAEAECIRLNDILEREKRGEYR